MRGDRALQCYADSEEQSKADDDGMTRHARRAFIYLSRSTGAPIACLNGTHSPALAGSRGCARRKEEPVRCHTTVFCLGNDQSTET